MKHLLTKGISDGSEYLIYFCSFFPFIMQREQNKKQISKYRSFVIKVLHVTIFKSQKPSSCNSALLGKQLNLISFHPSMNIEFSIMPTVNEIQLREQFSL